MPFIDRSDPLASYGAWTWHSAVDVPLAQHLDGLGYRTLWLGAAHPELAGIGELLDATERITIATGIVNIWWSDPGRVAAEFVALAERHPGRLILGIGSGHPKGEVGIPGHATTPAAARPYRGLSDYLERLELGGVPRDAIVIGALGPRLLQLAGERAGGAHPYLVPPRHTAAARAILGAGKLLVPEQKVVLESDQERARARARVAAGSFAFENYQRNMERLGYAPDEITADNDDLLDDVVAWGDDARIAARLRLHLDAGADQVAVQILTEGGDDLADAYTRLAHIIRDRSG